MKAKTANRLDSVHEKMLQSSDWRERAAVFEDEDIADHIFENGLKDDDYRVRRAVCRHPCFQPTEEQLRTGLMDTDAGVATAFLDFMDVEFHRDIVADLFGNARIEVIRKVLLLPGLEPDHSEIMEVLKTKDNIALSNLVDRKDFRFSNKHLAVIDSSDFITSGVRSKIIERDDYPATYERVSHGKLADDIFVMIAWLKKEQTKKIMDEDLIDCFFNSDWRDVLDALAERDDFPFSAAQLKAGCEHQDEDIAANFAKLKAKIESKALLAKSTAAPEAKKRTTV